jgi:DNA polymerase elongation subunit (family B)
MKKPKVLIVDIETAPMLGYIWGLWENNVSLEQLYKDWHILSWSAKWLGDPPSKIMYADQRNMKNIEDDKSILKKVWRLLDQTDIVITQNGKAFDHKKLNARFILQGMQPPSSYKHIDTLLIAKKHFSFTSNKLAYMSDKLCTKYKKLKPTKFPGFEMWLQCLAGNKAAWREMEKYNKHDVLALEELYYKLIPWDNSIDFNLYTDSTEIVCKCGSKSFTRNGYAYTSVGKFKRWKCKSCGSETRGRQNLLSQKKRGTIRLGTVRS